MKESIRTDSNACKEIVLVFAAFFLPGILFGAPIADARAFEQLSHHLLVLTVALPQIGLILYLLTLQPWLHPARYGVVSFRPADLLRALGLLLLLLLVPLVLTGVLLLLPDVQRLLENGFRWRFGRWEYAPLVILTSIVVGYREELFFRGYLIGRLEDAGVGRGAAVMGGSVLFGLGHLYQGLPGFIVATLTGLILSVAFLRRRSVHGIALAHGLYNSAVLFVSAMVAQIPA